MRSIHVILTACVLVTCWSSRIATAEPSKSNESPTTQPGDLSATADISSGNAALQYWQAFALIPPPEAVTPQMLADWNKVTLDETVRKAVQSSERSLYFMHRAMKYDTCEWGLADELGAEMPLPHLSKSRELGRLALLRARLRIEDNNAAEAMDDAIATLWLSRNIGRDRWMISRLVQISIEGSVVGFVAANLDHFPEPALRKWEDAVARAPQARKLSAILLDESDLVLAPLKSAVGADAETTWKHWEVILGRESAAKLKRELKGDPTQLKSAVDDALKLWRDLAAAADRPFTDAVARELGDVQKRAGDSNALVRLFAPSISVPNQAIAVMATKQSMLHAAIVRRLDGAAAFENVRDPFGNGPFVRMPEPGGYVLQSKLKERDGRSVSLTVIEKKAPER